MLTRQRNRIMNPIIRVDQAKPMRGMRDSRRRGKITPPMAPPAVAMPVVVPRRREKKWPTAAMEGVNRRAVPIPPRREKVRMKCQYSISR
jgi:hypothetical protein